VPFNIYRANVILLFKCFIDMQRIIVERYNTSSIDNGFTWEPVPLLPKHARYQRNCKLLALNHNDSGVKNNVNSIFYYTSKTRFNAETRDILFRMMQIYISCRKWKKVVSRNDRYFYSVYFYFILFFIFSRHKTVCYRINRNLLTKAEFIMRTRNILRILISKVIILLFTVLYCYFRGGGKINSKMRGILLEGNF